MSDATDLTAATGYVNLYANPTGYPDVSADVDDILATCKRASTWAATTTYKIGAVVLPTDNKRNGHRYRLIGFDGDGVQSGATEPSWPTTRDETVSDGNLTWREDGAEYDNIYDKALAVYKVWDLKYSIAATENVDFTEDGQGHKLSQILTQIDVQRKRWQQVGIA